MCTLDCANGSASAWRPTSWRPPVPGERPLRRPRRLQHQPRLWRDRSRGAGAPSWPQRGADVGFASMGTPTAASRSTSVAQSSMATSCWASSRSTGSPGRPRRGSTVVVSVLSNGGLAARVEQPGGRVVRTPVGDKYILDAMLFSGAGVGGEKSGHVIIREHTTSGDGIVTALEILSILARSGRPLFRAGRGHPAVSRSSSAPSACVTRTSGRRTGGWSQPCVRPRQSWRGGARPGASVGHRAGAAHHGRGSRTPLGCSRWPTPWRHWRADRLNQPS